MSDIDLKAHPDWEVDYIAATPRMAYYIEHSTRIYKIYLNYIAPEDIHVYSIDRSVHGRNGLSVHLRSHGTRIGKKNDRRCTAADWHHGNRRDWHQSVPLQSSNGHRAKHIPADKDGVRIAELDEMTYRRKLWTHRPLTDFWRVEKP